MEIKLENCLFLALNGGKCQALNCSRPCISHTNYFGKKEEKRSNEKKAA